MRQHYVAVTQQETKINLASKTIVSKTALQSFMIDILTIL